MSKRWLEYTVKLDRYVPIRPPSYAPAAKRYLNATNFFEVHKLSNGIDVFKLVYVDPAEITFVTGRQWRPWSDSIHRIGEVLSGEWDSSPPSNIPDEYLPYPRQFTEHDLYQSFEEHFVDGVPWEETTRYGSMLSNNHRADDRGSDEIFAALDQFDRLYDDIRTNGYRTQFELAGRFQSYVDLFLGEVLVDVGRSGELLFVDGRHRLSIAKILDLDRIPVFVLVRHREWLEEVNRQSGDELRGSEDDAESILLVNE